ncbi:MAG: tyrosine-type recombinase/integrase [Blastocatellia bacterium]|nr:tyrosine-type recombinase/integrase [Blastocatellia bacterium]
MADQINQNLIIVPPGSLAFEEFNPKIMTPFFERSVSEETRRAYRRVAKEFFAFLRHKHPAEINQGDVQRWRDHLIALKKSDATVRLKLSVIRSMFDYLKIAGIVDRNPALTKLVRPPVQSDDLRGRALTNKEVSYVLSGPDQSKAEGARDYALILLMLRTSLRVSEACSLKVSSIKWSHGRWILKFKVKGGRERTIPLPPEVKKAIDNYLRLDKDRRKLQHCDNNESYIFQPLTNYRTLIFDKPLSKQMAWNIVKKWGDFGGIGKISPHDLRRTAITKALDQGLTYRQVQMMTGHKDPKTVMRYDHGRENLEQNAVNFLNYEEK